MWPLTSTSSIWACWSTPGRGAVAEDWAAVARHPGDRTPAPPVPAAATFRGYAATVGELNDRRARKKAQTRELIRDRRAAPVRRAGFDAVTIADIARESDVAVQTVFNHFATKEELFFDGRTSWVDGPAEAVRSREPSVPP